MKNVRFFFFDIAQIQTAKARIGEGFIVVAVFETRQRGNRIDANPEQIMWIRLEKRQRLRIELANFGEIVGVADLSHSRILLLLRQARQVIYLLSVNARDVATRRL